MLKLYTQLLVIIFILFIPGCHTGNIKNYGYDSSLAILMKTVTVSCLDELLQDRSLLSMNFLGNELPPSFTARVLKGKKGKSYVYAFGMIVGVTNADCFLLGKNPDPFNFNALVVDNLLTQWGDKIEEKVYFENGFEYHYQKFIFYRYKKNGKNGLIDEVDKKSPLAYIELSTTDDPSAPNKTVMKISRFNNFDVPFLKGYRYE